MDYHQVCSSWGLDVERFRFHLHNPELMSKLNLLRKSNPDTGSALHWALSENSLLQVDDTQDKSDIIKALIDQVYDINQCDGHGRTALMLAIKNSHDMAVSILLKHPKIKIHHRDMNGRTVLHHLFSYESENADDVTKKAERIKILQVIYDAIIRNPSIYPADLMNYRSIRGWTPEVAAVAYKDTNVLELLHKYNSDKRWYSIVGRLSNFVHCS